MTNMEKSIHMRKISNNLKRFLILILLFTMGCQFGNLLNDPAVYSIKGEISESFSNEKIKLVNIELVCKRKNITTKALSDKDGFFIIEGKGDVIGCSLVFKHFRYKEKTIILKDNLRKEPLVGLNCQWDIPVNLNPLPVFD